MKLEEKRQNKQGKIIFDDNDNHNNNNLYYYMYYYYKSFSLKSACTILQNETKLNQAFGI